MKFELVNQLLNTIVRTIENTAVVSVRNIKNNVFGVRVTNPVKKVDVKGTVIVGNQKKLEEKIKDLNKLQKETIKTIKNFSVKEHKTHVLNPTEKIEVTNLSVIGDEIVKTNELVPKVSGDVQSLHKYLKGIKKIDVGNQPIKELTRISKELLNLQKEIKKLELSPEINVSPSTLPEINIPAPIVKVDKEKIDYKKLEKLIPNFDWDKLEKIISENTPDIISSGGGGGKYAFKDTEGNRGQALTDSTGKIYIANNGQTTDYEVSDSDEADDNNKYYGFTKADGGWYILFQDVTAGTYRYIKGDENYINAWSNRDSLVYDYYYNIF
jgi:hypothetical protein